MDFPLDKLPQFGAHENYAYHYCLIEHWVSWDKDVRKWNK